MPRVMFSITRDRTAPSRVRRLVPLNLGLNARRAGTANALRDFPRYENIYISRAMGCGGRVCTRLVYSSLNIRIRPCVLHLVGGVGNGSGVVLVSSSYIFSNPPVPNYRRTFSVGFS